MLLLVSLYAFACCDVECSAAEQFTCGEVEIVERLTVESGRADISVLACPGSIDGESLASPVPSIEMNDDAFV